MRSGLVATQDSLLGRTRTARPEESTREERRRLGSPSRTQDTYPLSHFRQHTGDHLKRLAEGWVETITQNGEAAMVVMSPETYDAMRIALERGHLWDEAIARFEAGERGTDAREAIDQVAARLNLKL